MRGCWLGIVAWLALGCGGDELGSDVHDASAEDGGARAPRDAGSTSDAGSPLDAALVADEDANPGPPALPTRAEQIVRRDVAVDLPWWDATSLVVRVEGAPQRVAEDGSTLPLGVPLVTSDGATWSCRGRAPEGSIVCLRDREGAMLPVAPRMDLVRVSEDGTVEIVASLASFPGAGNDLVVAPDGSVYLTNRCDGHPRCADAPDDAIGSVVRVSPEGDAREVHRGLPNPNGIALARDARSLYVAASAYRDRARAALHRLPIAADGTLGAPERVVAVSEPDGLAIDAWDRVWAASRDAIVVVDPRDGAQLGRVTVGARVTNVAIGGGRAWATTHGRGVFAARLE